MDQQTQGAQTAQTHAVVRQYPVDEELYPILISLQQAGLETEFSCAGVSPLDEPVDHSLYAYLTFSQRVLRSGSLTCLWKI